MLGIAYAAITTQSFNASGTATAVASDANFDVRFTGSVTSDGDGTVSGYIDTADTTGKTAVINVSGLQVKGQKATGSINVINNSADINAVLEITNIIHSNTTWFKVDAEFGETTYWDSATQQPILLPGETVPVYVTVELLDTPATSAEVAAAKDSMTVKISADATDVVPEELGSGGSGGSGDSGGDTGDVELITFTLDYWGEVYGPYQAEKGMTWKEFVESKYNTDGFYIRASTNNYGDINYDLIVPGQYTVFCPITGEDEIIEDNAVYDLWG